MVENLKAGKSQQKEMQAETNPACILFNPVDFSGRRTFIAVSRCPTDIVKLPADIFLKTAPGP